MPLPGSKLRKPVWYREACYSIMQAGIRVHTCEMHAQQAHIAHRSDLGCYKSVFAALPKVTLLASLRKVEQGGGKRGRGGAFWRLLYCTVRCRTAGVELRFTTRIQLYTQFTAAGQAGASGWTCVVWVSLSVVSVVTCELCEDLAATGEWTFAMASVSAMRSGASGRASTLELYSCERGEASNHRQKCSRGRSRQ